MRLTFIAAAAAAALSVGGCAQSVAPEIVYVATDVAPPAPPEECLPKRDPAFPRLPDGDVTADAAIHDRIEIRRRYREIARRRAVCARWLEQIGADRKGHRVAGRTGREG